MDQKTPLSGMLKPSTVYRPHEQGHGQICQSFKSLVSKGDAHSASRTGSGTLNAEHMRVTQHLVILVTGDWAGGSHCKSSDFSLSP